LSGLGHVFGLGAHRVDQVQRHDVLENEKAIGFKRV
jgi:hypothetical protein